MLSGRYMSVAPNAHIGGKLKAQQLFYPLAAAGQVANISFDLVTRVTCHTGRSDFGERLVSG